DFLVGFFVILEDQYRVGDSVSITANGGTFSGKIEDLTLRYTSVRGGDGTLYEVGNGNILFVANRSRGVGNITVDVRVQREGSLRDMEDRKSTRLNSSHVAISYAVVCLKKKNHHGGDALPHASRAVPRAHRRSHTR